MRGRSAAGVGHGDAEGGPRCADTPGATRARDRRVTAVELAERREPRRRRSASTASVGGAAPSSTARCRGRRRRRLGDGANARVVATISLQAAVEPRGRGTGRRGGESAALAGRRRPKRRGARRAACARRWPRARRVEARLTAFAAPRAFAAPPPGGAATLARLSSRELRRWRSARAAHTTLALGRPKKRRLVPVVGGDQDQLRRVVRAGQPRLQRRCDSSTWLCNRLKVGNEDLGSSQQLVWRAAAARNTSPSSAVCSPPRPRPLRMCRRGDVAAASVFELLWRRRPGELDARRRRRPSWRQDGGQLVAGGLDGARAASDGGAFARRTASFGGGGRRRRRRRASPGRPACGLTPAARREGWRRRRRAGARAWGAGRRRAKAGD